MLDTLDVAKVGDGAETWEKVVRKLHAGVMPPAGLPRPDETTYAGFVSWLETELDRAAAVQPNPGRTEPFHRLNRAEYQNVIRDLLSVDIDVTGLLPGDDASYGFDNMAGVQRMSPTLMERYLTAAQRISRVAVGASDLTPTIDTFAVPPDLPQDDRLDGLPFGTRGGTVVRYTFPRDGEYTIRMQIARTNNGESLPDFDQPQTLEISVDGERLEVFTLPPMEPGTGRRSDRRKLDADWQVRYQAKAGPRAIELTFLNRTPALLENFIEPFLKPYEGGSNAHYTTRKGAYLRSIEIGGPFNVSGAGDTPSRRRIFVCHPASRDEEAGCANTILSALARRAYRRPVTDSDLRGLLTFYNSGRAKGSFEMGIERALDALLVSPEFLFRVERDPTSIAPNTAYRVSDLELASRLSFFLWSSIPDDDLLDVAVRQELRQPAVLEQQVRRMLADTRSEALISNFVGQWLLLRNVAALAPDTQKDPEFDESLRQAFRRETELFCGSILREDRSVLELLTANYTFVNERLARHYGIPNVQGSHFRRITLQDDHRRGLLGHGSILSVTAFPHRTSPVLRGKFVLENLLGTPIPDPPPNVPPLDESKNASDEGLSMRQRIARHRANPVCASCHSMMDPPGLALENFDFVGRWRTVDESFNAIDASGVLPDGTKFEGPAGLLEVMVKHPERFATTLTEKLVIYALGRGLQYYDMPAIRAITHEAARTDYRVSSVIMGIVNSTPFRMRRSPS